MTRLGIVTGLAFEAEILRKGLQRIGSDAAIAIAGPARARAAADRLIGDGATALMSFGIAGALDPTLQPGDVVLADNVIGPLGDPMPTDAAWRAELARRIGDRTQVKVVGLAGSDRPVCTPAEKAAIFGSVGAAAVDMESHAVAAAAAARGLPFLAVRAIADSAGRAIPAWVFTTTGTDGRLRIAPLLRGLLSGPGEWGSLVGLARDSQAAKAALRRVVSLGAPGFGIA